VSRRAIARSQIVVIRSKASPGGEAQARGRRAEHPGALRSGRRQFFDTGADRARRGQPDNNSRIRLLEWLGADAEKSGLRFENVAFVHFRAGKNIQSPTVRTLLKAADCLRASLGPSGTPKPPADPDEAHRSAVSNGLRRNLKRSRLSSGPTLG